MNRKTAITVIAALSAAFISTAAEETKTEPKKQTTCPVMMGQPIEKALYTDVKGKRIYVCCQGCIAQIKGNPDKYIKRLEDQGVVFEKAPESEKKEQ